MCIKHRIRMLGIVLISIMCVSSCKENNPEPPKEIPFYEIRGFAITGEGSKLLATEKGLFYFDETDHNFKPHVSDINKEPLNDLAIGQGELTNLLWLASNGGAVELYSQIHITMGNSALLHNNISSIHVDKQEVVYMATPFGISIKNDDTWLDNIGRDSLYLNHIITDMASASNGYTYVATNGGGVGRFMLDVDGVSGATVFDTEWTLLESNNILTVFIDDTVQAYGTEGGVALHYSEYTKWDWETFTTADGLISDTVLAIVRDNDDAWWFGTQKGLSQLKNDTWTTYSVANTGFISDTIKHLALDVDGSLWFASNSGLAHFTDNAWRNYRIK